MHLFEDVEQKYERTFGVMSGVLRLGSPLWDLEYADDTVLLSNSSHQVQDFQVSLSDAVKNLGVSLDPRSNNHKAVSTRVSRGLEVSTKLTPFMKHPAQQEAIHSHVRHG